MSDISVDLGEYSRLVQSLASLSGLFTRSNVAYLDSKFVENLYARTAHAENFALSDMSFDAILKNGAGVGVKTFRATSASSSKKEKVAEFPKAARELELHKLKGRELALAISNLRNRRVESDAAEYNIVLPSSIYHCLVRLEQGLFVHEEPYSLIDLDDLSPIDARGKTSGRWPTNHGHLHFTDNHSNYTYNVSKNVLYKTFVLDAFENSDLIPVVINSDPFGILSEIGNASGRGLPVARLGEESVVLPLYSKKGSHITVSEKSGINHWNAGGRPRTFGEAYIPIPSVIHEIKPGFFPTRNHPFTLSLPNGRAVSAKVCQAGGKALMSDPNVDLVQWLFTSIDGSMARAEERHESKRPYTYQDLVFIGKDCVEIRKIESDHYELRMCPLGEFENFVESSRNH
jgi:hypothetical protein